MSKRQNKLIRRYQLVDMLMHWTIALGFLLALITGYLIFFQGTSTLMDQSAGHTSRLIHRIGAVLFVVAPVIYFIFSKKRFGFLSAFKWGKSDLGWLKAAPKHYFLGGELPPQTKYNSGQKLYYLFALVFGLLLAVTGFALWFDWFTGAAGIFMLVVHDISALVLTLFFGVHVYLTVFHPSERASFNAMATGYMDSEYAEHHHEIWYNEVKDQDRKNDEQLQEKPESQTM
ncbi:cytochrome b/b6 domain-containing protein [Robertmurraya massiliosenegalensis]|uniref:formate dehydrogenase subunit gamma n=1 Tax=Robertmurraya TaxID=2837507 RepID=UPI0039A40AC6